MPRPEEAELHRARNQAAARERSRWLDDLSQAVAQAQKVAWTLGVVEGDSEVARTLYARLESIRSELESLRFGDRLGGRKQINPKRIHGLNSSEIFPDQQDA